MPGPEYHRKRKQERRKKFLALLGGKCESCGATDDLHFDHDDPSTKEFSIGRNLNGREDVLEQEVKKCKLLCPQCHRSKTHENWEYKDPQSDHGTLWRYKKYKCRCDRCKKRMSEYYYSKSPLARVRR